MSTSHEFIRGFHGVRYQTKDVSRAIAFYVDHLGFKLEHQQLPAFAAISYGPLHILLSGPEASGSRPMPDGTAQQPGGWNRVVLRVADLAGMMATCEKRGCGSATKWKPAREESRFSCSILTEIRSSCSSRLNDDSMISPMPRQRTALN